MNRRTVAAVAAGALALGVLVGAAGAIVARDATTPTATTFPAHMAAMNMHGMMAGQPGAHGSAPMMEMMGGGMTAPGSGMELHWQHHPDLP